MTHPPARSSSRRAFLVSAGTAAVASLAGCNGARYQDRYEPGERVSLTVSAPPADDDRVATTIARTLRDRLHEVGVQASFEPKRQSQLYLDALINHDFDVFVARMPGVRDPDELYPLLHSSFAPEPGWQNPFGVASVTLDESLAAIRAAEDPSAELSSFLDAYVERVPFTVVAAPEFLTGHRSAVQVPAGVVPERHLDVLVYLAGVDGDDPFRCAIFSTEVTENRNPVAGEFSWGSQLLGLVYDSLAREPLDGSGYVPWAASDWTVDDRELVVDLRPDQQFHDGTDLTAADVAFTLEFLSDTSLGNAPSPVPATRFRGRTTLVSGARAVDDATVRYELADGVSRKSAERVLTLPILPESVWRDRATLVEDRVTRALVWKNRQPVGSGPLRFEGATVDESVRLTPFREHFLADVGDDSALSRYAGVLDGDGLQARYAPSGEDALAALADDRLDASLHSFPLHAFADVDGTDGVTATTATSRDLYVVGYNVRREPLSDFRFRQVLARLHDRERTVASVLEGFATATDLPVVDGSSDGAADAHTVGSFPGDDGELDVEAARDLFRDAGYTFDDAGELIR